VFTVPVVLSSAHGGIDEVVEVLEVRENDMPTHVEKKPFFGRVGASEANKRIHKLHNNTKQGNIR
jgi:hypothetical protein